MSTITRKIELKLYKEGLGDEQVKAQYKFLYDINDNLFKVANDISSKLYLDEHVAQLVRVKNPEYKKLLSELAKENKKKTPDLAVIAEIEAKIADVESKISVQELAINEYASEMEKQSLGYNIAKDGDTEIYAQILTTLNQSVVDAFKRDALDVQRGLRSIRNYKQGMPIPFPFNRNIKIFEKDNDFFLKWYNGITFKLEFGKDRSNNRAIVERALGKDKSVTGYKLRTCSIQLQKSKMFLLLVVDIPQEKRKLNKSIVVGVDLGINVPAYVATNCTEDREAIGDREHFLNSRLAFQRRYKSLQRLKNTRGGRGRGKKLEPLEKIREAEHKWVQTQNHLFSKRIVEFALKVQAATIQMENLSNFGKTKEGEADEKKKFLLRNWSFYELQSMIEYKAKRYGIKVVFIKPAYTSKKCSWCGEEGHREENDKTRFHCLNPNCKMHKKEYIHADYNAARNIALSKEIL